MSEEPAATPETDANAVAAPSPGRPPLRHVLTPQDWIGTAQTAVEEFLGAPGALGGPGPRCTRCTSTPGPPVWCRCP